MSYPIETYCDRCHTVHAGRCAPEFTVSVPMITNSKPERDEPIPDSVCGNQGDIDFVRERTSQSDKHKRVAERLDDVLAEIIANTGPTGGWLCSPKKLQDFVIKLREEYLNE